MADRYWNPTANANWDSTSAWATTDGGTPNASVPTSSDNVFFSNTNSYKCTINVDASCLTLDATYGSGFSGELAGSSYLQIYGSLILNSGMNYSATGVVFFYGTGSYILNSNSKQINGGIFINSSGLTLTLANDLTIPITKSIFLSNGTFTCINGSDNYSISCGGFSISSGGTCYLGSGTHIIGSNASGTLWSCSSSHFYCGTSTIKFTGTTSLGLTFQTTNTTYYNVWFSRGSNTSTITIQGSCTYNSLKDDGTGAHSILFTAGTTNHFTNFIVNGLSSKLITLNSTTTNTVSLVKDGGGNVVCNNLNIQHVVASPSGSWFASNSVNNQPTATAGSGWTFIGSTPLSIQF